MSLTAVVLASGVNSIQNSPKIHRKSENSAFFIDLPPPIKFNGVGIRPDHVEPDDWPFSSPSKTWQ